MATSRSSGADLILPAAAAALPLVFGPFVTDVYEVPKLAVAGLLSAAGAAALLRGGRLWSARSSVDAALLAFSAAVLAAAAVSADRWLSAYGLRGARTLPRAAAAASIPVSLYGLSQVAGHDLVSFRAAGGAALWAPTAMGGRAVATFGAPVALGAYLAVTLPLALQSALDAKSGKGWRALGAAACVLAAAALAASGARGALLAAAAGCGAVLLAGAGRARRGAVLAVAAAAAAALAVALATRGARNQTFSDSRRLAIWGTALRGWADAPWLGSGPDTFLLEYRTHKTPALARSLAAQGEGEPRSAHDDLLEALATTGIVGLGAWGWLQASAARAGLAAARTDRAAAAFAGAGLAALVAAKVNPLPYAAAWLACAYAGCALSLPPASASKPWNGALALAGAAWCGLAALGWLAADFQAQSGRVARAEGRPARAAERFEAAVALRPGEPRYVADLQSVLWDAASALPAERQGPLLARGVSVALAEVRLRPRDADGYRVLGQAELAASRLADPSHLERAAWALGVSDTLDPGIEQTSALQARVARLRGDKIQDGE
jgi:O-antigen ligase